MFSCRDIHIKTGEDFILQKARGIVSAVKSVSPKPSAYLLAVTGDIAFSGKVEQYELACTFISAIKQGLDTPESKVFQFFIPGNHDLDFLSEPDTREALLHHVRQHLEKVDPAGDDVKQILSIQKNFFTFEAQMLGLEERPAKSRLAYSCTFSVAGNSVRVNCFNTAWVSTNPENPGTLSLFPLLWSKSQRIKTALEISAFHHPTNWLIPDNGRAIRCAIERSSDIIFTGHEHESSVYRKSDSQTGDTEHIEGAVLQVDGSSDVSAFHIVVVDNDSYEVFLSSWNNSLYTSKSLGVRPFVRNRIARKSTFQPTPAFAALLLDPGLPILHPKKHDIAIDDLFIYPALACKDPEKKFQVLRVISGQGVLDYVRSTPRLVVVGDEMCGKTWLAKKLCRQLLDNGGGVPIFVTGTDFKGHKERDIRRLIKTAVEEQYGEEYVERYMDLDVSQRALIVDDWHELKYTATAKGNIVEQLKGYFGKLIFLTTRLYAIEELAKAGPSTRAPCLQNSNSVTSRNSIGVRQVSS